jgi:membrane-associated phospholipid phosphatase
LAMNVARVSRGLVERIPFAHIDPMILVAAAVVGISLAAASTSRMPGDMSMASLMDRFDHPWLEFLMRAASWPVNKKRFLFVFIPALTWIFYRHRTHAVSLAITSVVGVYLLPIVKEMIGRARPESASHLQDSFPSGHSFLAVLLFGSLFYMADRLVGPDTKRITLFRWAMVLAILAVGASRVYLDHHWASDIIGGYLWGVMFLMVAFKFANAFHAHVSHTEDASQGRRSVLGERPRD